MRVLAIESSSVTASAAILTDNTVTAEYSTNFKQTHSQTLLPMIDSICTMTGTPVESIDLIAVSAGPGSFTGLRIGSATGKGIGLALGKPVVSVPTLEGLAMNVSGTDRIVCPIMDARRGNVYAGIYRFNYNDGGNLEIIMNQSLLAAQEVMEKLNQLGRPVVFAGDAVYMYRELIELALNIDAIIAADHNVMPRAASVAVRGVQLANMGLAADAAEHVPDYLRPSQAERERADRNEA